MRARQRRLDASGGARSGGAWSVGGGRHADSNRDGLGAGGENNGYAIHEPISKRWATTRLCERVATYGIPTSRIDDQDVFAIREAAQKAVSAIRDGAGPAFMECLTYRWREHVGPHEDYDSGYRGLDELRPWRESDQVERLAQMLPKDAMNRISEEVAAQIDDAFNFAEASPIPDQSELLRHVYASRA